MCSGLVDAQGHGIISAKISSTVHDTFHAFIHRTRRVWKDNAKAIRKHQSQAGAIRNRNALGRDAHDESREIATMIYGEIRPSGHFRFVNFGSPPPLIFSAEYGCFMPMNTDHLVQFPALGLEIPEDHPDRNRYLSMAKASELRRCSGHHVDEPGRHPFSLLRRCG
jgi:hypothetical protein